ncbi:MAG: hypothetical protein D6683_05630 [Actinomyces sp.]|nr:MAG: hypothetical protein D6683_05630 [Actinomyces sp.]
MTPGALAVTAGSVTDIVVELALPRTDAGVVVQWLVMVPLWVTVLVATRRLRVEYRRFVLGLVVANLAWFAARTVH